ncbi:MAG: polysaccharide deacetylase family protein [Bacteroidales bacterium]|jgi:peptidoglycan/xylan/chitin deacetylase (PgdA/CDA1 family)|nr:polysaccharide deacetylase family protein [Bacteroidales bacterium]
MNKVFLTSLLLLLSICVTGQSKVAITIDDVPNTKKFAVDNYRSKLLNKLDMLNIPVTIFINEGMLYKTDSVTKNFNLLKQWIDRGYTTPGNHTFAHSRYSAAGYKNFTADIINGEAITKELSALNKKPLRYFRFPYNDLGKDSIQKKQIEAFLEKRGYISTPFTIESSDWVFNYLYEHYTKHNKKQEAERVAKSYIDITLKYFHYFDSLAVKQYGRHINQIYLCHDNAINADYIDVLVKRLKEDNYSIIALDEAMQDDVYKQKNNYNKKWGVSWFYRWMTNKDEIKKLMHKEPEVMAIYKEYKEVQ